MAAAWRATLPGILSIFPILNKCLLWIQIIIIIIIDKIFHYQLIYISKIRFIISSSIFFNLLIYFLLMSLLMINLESIIRSTDEMYDSLNESHWFYERFCSSNLTVPGPPWKSDNESSHRIWTLKKYIKEVKWRALERLGSTAEESRTAPRLFR